MKNLKDWVNWAKKEGVAIGHFNISDSEGFKAVLEARAEVSQEAGFEIPVIIGVSEGERDFIGLEEIASLVKIARGNGLPVFLNADHTYSVEKSKMAIDAGVDSVIIDNATKPLEENIALTKEVVSYARSVNPEIVVEGELGFIGQSSKVLDSIPEGVSEETQTTPEDALTFVQATGVDMLAPSVGNIHGIVKTGEPKLNIERIRAIAERVGIPLVLHGGSGNSDQEFLEAIKAGIRIIHINTELRVAYRDGIIEGLKSGEVAPYKFMSEGVEGMKGVVLHKLRLFNNL